MKRLLFYLFVAAATLYTAILYGSTSFLMLFYVELALPAVLFVISIPLARRVHVELQLPIPLAEAGQTVPVVIWLNNSTPLPCGKIAVQLTSYYPMKQKGEKTWFYGSVPGRRKTGSGRARLCTEFDAECVGSVQIEINRVWCYDLIGLLAVPLSRRQWKQLEPETLLVVPAISEVPVFVSRQSRDFAGESEVYSKERGGDDPSEAFQIRDYKPGDKLRSIYWKLSAKTDELMVCERSLPLGCPVVFYLNLFQQSIRGRWDPWNYGQSAKRDSFLRIAASLSYAMVREGCRHYIIWYDTKNEDVQRYRIEKEEDVYEMLIQLGRLSTYSKEIALEELYRQKYHETQAVTKLELTIDLVLYQNEEKLIKYDKREEKLEQQLGEQEIIV